MLGPGKDPDLDQELDNKHKFSILHNCHFYQLLPVNFNGKVDTRYSSFSKWNLELVSFWILLDSNNSYLNLEHLIITSYHSRYTYLTGCPTAQLPNAQMFDFFRKSSLTLKQQVLKMLQDEKKVRKNGSIEYADFDFLKNITDDKLENIVEHEPSNLNATTSKLKKLIC